MRLLDFGLARARWGHKITHSGLALGTPEYMAPEQARGNQQDIGPRADIFSLGCIFYECLIGEPAFAGDHIAAVLAKILIQEAPRIKTVWPQVPPLVDALVARMMAKDPRQRPADAGALLLELAAFGELPAADVRAPVEPPRSVHNVSLADDEQRLFSVVIAAPSGAMMPNGARLPETHARRTTLRHSVLQRALDEFGAQCELLLDGSVVATLMESGCATDQVAEAARCALTIYEHWPKARVALATGRGVLTERSPVGEVIDRAVRMVRASLPSPSGDASAEAAQKAYTGVWLDEVSEGLLDARFVVARTEYGRFLQVEHAALDESRLLLGKPTPCLGREYELRLLDSLLMSCIEEPESRAVLVTAPPGIGKSRLRHEFLRRLQERSLDVEILFGRGEPLRLGSPYAILSQALRQACGLRPGEPLPAQRAKLAAHLTRYVDKADAQRVAEFLGQMCQLPFPDEDSVRLRAARNDPKIMVDQVIRAFLDWLRAECGQRPVMLILEDLHWGDTLTTRLLSRALLELQDQPFLVFALARPEVWQQLPSQWLDHRLQEIRLAPLSRKASERLVHEALGTTVPPDGVKRLVELAAGNALYLEELIRAHAEGKGAAPPETVLAMLMARIVRLGAGARRVLRGASLFGASFWSSGVAALYGTALSATELNSSLAILLDAEIIEPRRQRRFPGEPEFAFRHSLMRDAAYGMLTDEDRLLGHRLVATYLQQLGETDAMVLAEHCRHGGDLTRALPYYIRAAEQSYQGHDLQETLLRVSQCLACGAQGEDLGLVRGLEFLARFGRAEWSEALAVGQEALSLLPTGGRWWCTAMSKMVIVVANMNQPAALEALLKQLASVEPSADARGVFIAALCQVVIMLSLLGQKDSARLFLERILQAGVGVIEQDAAARGFLKLAHYCYAHMYETDPWQNRVLAEASFLAFQQADDLRNVIIPQKQHGLALAELGDPAAGESALRLALLQAEKLGESFLICDVTLYLASVLADNPATNQEEDALRMANSVIALNMSPNYTGCAFAILSQILCRQGQAIEAEAEARKAVAMLTPMPHFQITAYVNLVRALLAQGRTVDARLEAEAGLQRVVGLGGTGYNEVGMRLAVAEACHAAGEEAAALDALAAALAQLHLRAARIPEGPVREQFMHGVPEHARAQALARQWLRGAELAGVQDA